MVVVLLAGGMFLGAGCGGDSVQVSEICREAFATADVDEINSDRDYGSVSEAGYECATVDEFAAAITEVDGINLEQPLTTRVYSPSDMGIGQRHAVEYCDDIFGNSGSLPPICEEFDVDGNSGRATLRR